jgi:hypothetical protein
MRDLTMLVLASGHFPDPAFESSPAGKVWLRILRKANTLVLSDPGKIAGDPAMRSIIALGEDVAPHTLCDLWEKPSLLVWASTFRPSSGGSRIPTEHESKDKTIPRAKEAAMSIAEIIHAFQALSRCEKFQIAQMLLDDLAKEELLAAFTEGHVFPIYTPEYAPDAAAQLAQALVEEGTNS